MRRQVRLPPPPVHCDAFWPLVCTLLVVAAICGVVFLTVQP